MIQQITRFPHAKNILEHNDGIIDQHANSQGQAAERHDIERSVTEIQQGKGRNDRNGNRRGDDDGATEITKKQ